MTQNELHALVMIDLMINQLIEVNADNKELAKAAGDLKLKPEFKQRMQSLAALHNSANKAYAFLNKHRRTSTDITMNQYNEALIALSKRLTAMFSLSDEALVIMNKCLDGLQNNVIPVFVPVTTAEMQTLSKASGVDIESIRKVVANMADYEYKFKNVLEVA